MVSPGEEKKYWFNFWKCYFLCIKELQLTQSIKTTWPWKSSVYSPLISTYMCCLVLRTLLPFIHRSLPHPYLAQVNIRHCLFRIFAKDVVFHQISLVKPSVLTDNDGTPTPTISAEFIFHYFGIYQLSDTICMRKAICHQ